MGVVAQDIKRQRERRGTECRMALDIKKIWQETRQAKQTVSKQLFLPSISFSFFFQFPSRLSESFVFIPIFFPSVGGSEARARKNESGNKSYQRKLFILLPRAKKGNSFFRKEVILTTLRFVPYQKICHRRFRVLYPGDLRNATYEKRD